MNNQALDSGAVKKTIASVRITRLPKKLGDPLPEVWVTLSDGAEKMLFRYYPDEISFNESELVGLTEEEALLLKFGRDRAFIQS
jgi:hypothetical protein